LLGARIPERFTYRVHDLGEFMEALMQQFTRWYNSKNDRTVTLWEERYKSVIVEDGIAAKMMAAYIDLNPVRAALVADPAGERELKVKRKGYHGEQQFLFGMGGKRRAASTAGLFRGSGTAARRVSHPPRRARHQLLGFFGSVAQPQDASATHREESGCTPTSG